ncbi:MAG: tetratricopeptide repeat protein [Lentisphaerales bacterium]|nr:tetratricopeptide repeat protein [Lentisphaerales bacterium]
MLRLSLRKFPGDYYTLSNLGVLYKKKGDFSKAAKFIEQALKIRPEGHMGLGDWYLKMLLYRANEETFEKKNFLGQEVLTKYLKLNKYKGKEKYFKLIKLKKMVLNDQHFADGFLALADFLSESGELNLALRAYMRAEVLGHSKSDYIQMRFNAVFKHVKHLFKDDDKTKSLVEKQREIILNEFKKAEQWSLEFQKAEAELIKKYPKAKVEYKHVYKLLKAKKISPYRP